jgi:EXPERA (EXPanded EBP superfamily)
VPLARRRFDLLLVCWFAMFVLTAFAMEPYTVFAIDLHRAHDPLAAAWRLYAERWDPIFLNPPPWLRLLCGADEFLFGPFYLLLIYAFVKRKNWIRIPALLFGAIVAFDVSVYFALEFWTERGRADLLMVVLINLPYWLVPILLIYRMRRAQPFAPPQGAEKDESLVGARRPQLAGDHRVP